MHELPGFAEASAAWTETRAAAIGYAESPRSGRAHAEAAARLRRAAIAYTDAWRRALDSLRGEFPEPPDPHAACLLAENERMVSDEVGLYMPAFQAFLGAAARLRRAPAGPDGGLERQSAIGDLVRAARMVKFDEPPAVPAEGEQP